MVKKSAEAKFAIYFAYNSRGGGAIIVPGATASFMSCSSGLLKSAHKKGGAYFLKGFILRFLMDHPGAKPVTIAHTGAIIVARSRSSNGQRIRDVSFLGAGTWTCGHGR